MSRKREQVWVVPSCRNILEEIRIEEYMKTGRRITLLDASDILARRYKKNNGRDNVSLFKL